MDSDYLYVVYHYPSDHSGWKVVNRIFLTENDAWNYLKSFDNDKNFWDGEEVRKYKIGSDFEDSEELKPTPLQDKENLE